MAKKVELTSGEAKMIVRALFEMDDEDLYNKVDRVNNKLAKQFNLNLAKIRQEECR